MSAAGRRTPDGGGLVRARGRDERGRPPLPRRQLATLPAGLLAPAAHRDGAAAAGLQSGGGRRWLNRSIGRCSISRSSSPTVVACAGTTSGSTSRATTSAMPNRSEEHTSELQSLMRISYAVFCLKKKNSTTKHKRNK